MKKTALQIYATIIVALDITLACYFENYFAERGATTAQIVILIYIMFMGLFAAFLAYKFSKIKDDEKQSN